MAKVLLCHSLNKIDNENVQLKFILISTRRCVLLATRHECMEPNRLLQNKTLIGWRTTQKHSPSRQRWRSLGCTATPERKRSSAEQFAAPVVLQQECWSRSGCYFEFWSLPLPGSRLLSHPCGGVSLAGAVLLPARRWLDSSIFQIWFNPRPHMGGMPPPRQVLYPGLYPPVFEAGDLIFAIAAF